MTKAMSVYLEELTKLPGRDNRETKTPHISDTGTLPHGVPLSDAVQKGYFIVLHGRRAPNMILQHGSFHVFVPSPYQRLRCLSSSTRTGKKGEEGGRRGQQR